MKLEKYKSKDPKKIGIIVFTVICILLVTGVFLYTSFASFETNETFNIINGEVEDLGDVYFAFYVDNELVSEMPLQNSGYILDEESSSCTNNATVTWNYTEWFPEVRNLTKTRTKCTLYFTKTKKVQTALGELEVYEYTPDFTKAACDSETCVSHEKGIFETEDTYYNIEVNRRYTKEIEKKNLAYLHQLSLRSIKKSKDYVKSKKVVQINLNNYDRFQKQEFVYKTKLIEENKYIQRNEEIEIYDVNLDYLYKVGYNYIKKNKLAKYLYLLVEENEEKIKKIYEGDELLMDVKKEAERILENFDALLYYDPYELGMKDGRSEGIEIGRDEGRSEGINETAMNFIKEGVDLSIIAKATDIDMQKLQQMAMTMKA